MPASSKKTTKSSGKEESSGFLIRQSSRTSIHSANHDRPTSRASSKAERLNSSRNDRSSSRNGRRNVVDVSTYNNLMENLIFFILNIIL